MPMLIEVVYDKKDDENIQLGVQKWYLMSISNNGVRAK